jgi:hypothetical protein
VTAGAGRRPTPSTVSARPARGLVQTHLFWLAPVAFAALASWLATLNQGIRHEELAEAIRNVFWLQDGLIYDGVYSNVGWYGTLLVVYKVFGFSTATAIWTKVAIYLGGLLAVASLLRRHLSPGAALVPLAMFALSPTWLHFTTLRTSFGTDVAYAAMCLWLIVGRAAAPRPGVARRLLRPLAAGCLAMVAAMSYPAFLFHLPALALVFIWQARREIAMGGSARGVAERTAAVAAGAAVPLGLAFALVETPQLLWLDPVSRAGLFRGGGQAGFDPGAAWRAVSRLFQDLFVEGRSYYLEVSRPDYGNPVAVAGLGVTLGLAIWLAITRRVNAVLPAAIGLAILSGIAGPMLSTDGEPGLRRSTVVIAALAALFALAWQGVLAARPRPAWRPAALTAMALIPISFAWNVPSLARDLSRPSVYENRDWFKVAGSADASFERLRARTAQGEQLACPVAPDGRITPCRYQEVYGALAGDRLWNHGSTAPVHALDWRTGRDIVLTPGLWRDGYFPTCSRPEICVRDMNVIFEQMRRAAEVGSRK